MKEVVLKPIKQEGLNVIRKAEETLTKNKPILNENIVKLDDTRLTEASKQYALTLEHKEPTNIHKVHKQLANWNDKHRYANRDTISYSDLSEWHRYMDELIERSR